MSITTTPTWVHPFDRLDAVEASCAVAPGNTAVVHRKVQRQAGKDVEFVTTDGAIGWDLGVVGFVVQNVGFRVES